MKPTPQRPSLISASRIGRILGPESVNALIEACDFRRKSKGGMLFREGDAGAGIFFILSGSVKLLRVGVDGRESVLHIAEGPTMIAEAAIFIAKYPASAEALTDVEFLYLSKERAFMLMERSGKFARFLLDSMSFWLKRLVLRIETLTQDSAASRLSRYLLEIQEKRPPKISPSAPKVTLPVKKGELAQLLNMHQPSLSRIFRKMQDDRVIEVRGSTITLLDLAALRRLTLPPLEE